MISITANLTIPAREILFKFGTSSGPGGQHVNKVETKVTLLFDVDNSLMLSESQRKKIYAALATRINKRGVMRVSSSKHRSQKANREAVIGRFILLLQGALTPKKKRRATSIPAVQKRRRLEQKRQRSETKRLRGRIR